MRDRTTVRLPRDLLLSAKRKATEEGRVLTSLIEDGLRLMMTAPPKMSARRVMPPISRATGGLWPGMDLRDLDALRDAEDLAYVAQRKRPE